MGDGIEYGSCTNIDECASDTTSGCLFGATCIEADDGYFCQCQDGYEGNEEGSFGCVEINECGSPELNNFNTNANCINTPGSYTVGAPNLSNLNLSILERFGYMLANLSPFSAIHFGKI